ncbi:hypothetical protein OBBRIDRAFT_7484 [Obba rivulosa]|uniref:Uncharacterized protein n=1 Tax=Obba rivulosa TaxID=1052685 RepID=A0A8E2DV04_9APHY|nr:hypothetical protein OBBRIDRAFT_7484 [Obba rivulosa]
MTGSSSASGSNKQRAASTVSTTNEVVELLSSDEESRPIKRARKDLYAASSSRPEQPPAKSDPRLSDENSLDYTSGYSADEEDVDPRVKEPIRKLQLQSIGEPDVESLRKIRDSLSASARIPASTKVLKTLRGSIRPSHSSRLSAPCPNQKPRSTSYAGELFYWEKFKYLRVQAPPVRQHDVHSRDSRGTRDRFRSIFGLTEQSLIHHSPGAINKVVQHNGCILAASAVSTGMYDEQPDAYNSDGALMYWNGKSALILHGHEDNPNSNNAASNKYYTVNDVQFDPLRPKSRGPLEQI